MSKKQKLRDRLFRSPPPRDFSWSQLVSLLHGYGINEKSGDGSRRRFYDPSKPEVPFLHMHKRHPDDTLLAYQVENVKAFLEEWGYHK